MTNDRLSPASAQPRVAVIVRTKNRPEFLRNALADIASQTFTDWEIVIVNDGGDCAIVDAIIEASTTQVRAQTTVIHNAESLGRWATANQGVQASHSEFIVLHDDDDFWDPQFLEITVHWLQTHPEDSGVVTRTQIVYYREAATGLVETDRAIFWEGQQAITYFDMLRVNRAVPISYLYRRTLHDEVGLYNESLPVVGDWEFNLRVLIDHSIGFIGGRPLAFWAQRPGLGGDVGNSVNASASDHFVTDRRIRDEAIRSFAREHGAGELLYIAKVLDEDRSRIDQELQNFYSTLSIGTLIRNDIRNLFRRIRRTRI